MPVRPNLGPRLAAIADAVPAGARVADIGTDHAQLLVWLHRAERIDRGIGIDIATGPLGHARRTVQAAAIDDLDLRHGDGLQPLGPREVDTVVIAGMGGARIIELLDASAAIVSSLDRLILQPNTDWVLVRRHIAARRWALLAETMVRDRDKFYVVSVVDPRDDRTPQWSEDALALGPRLLELRPPVFIDWLEHQLRRTERALQGARSGRPLEHHIGRVATLLARRDQLLRALQPAPTP